MHPPSSDGNITKSVNPLLDAWALKRVISWRDVIEAALYKRSAPLGGPELKASRQPLMLIPYDFVHYVSSRSLGIGLRLATREHVSQGST